MADYDSSQPIRTETNGDAVVSIADATTTSQTWSIDANGIGKVNLTDGTNTLAIDGNGAASVAFPAGSEFKVTDGTDTLEINGDGSINVIVQEGVSGGEVHVYDDTSGTAPNTPVTVVTYTVTTGKTLRLKGWKGACSGKAKFELKIGVAASEVLQDVSFVDSGNGNFETVFPQAIEVPTGQNVLIVGTNRDKANADLYGWINGEEV